MVIKNKFIKLILLLLLFCSITISVNIIFSILKTEEITKINILLSGGFGLILCFFFLITKRIG